VEPIDADAIPGSESRSSQSQYWELGTWGWGYAGTLPQLLKGSRTFGVAAGGCPASPSWLRGRCEGQGRAVPGPPTVWVAGLTADLSNLEGEVGQMRGFPLVGGFLRAPAASRWSGEPRPRKNTPGGGLAVLRALDNF